MDCTSPRAFFGCAKCGASLLACDYVGGRRCVPGPYAESSKPENDVARAQRPRQPRPADRGGTTKDEDTATCRTHALPPRQLLYVQAYTIALLGVTCDGVSTACASTTDR